jgi:hypothetical protein
MHLLRLPAILPVLIFIGHSLSACAGDPVKGAGAVVRKPVEVAAFHGVELTGSVDVMVRQGDAQKVEVEAQANLTDVLEFVVENGVCRIRPRTSFSTNKPFVVHVTVPVLDRVVVSGSGDVKSHTPFAVPVMHVAVSGSGDVELQVQVDSVDARLSGSGEIKLIGTARALEAEVRGSGDIKAGNLKVERARAYVSGSGDVTVNTAVLDAEIRGSGDVKYKGSKPAITSRITGSGSVRHVDQ